MIWLNYQRLKYFQMVAQEGSIARASEKLNLGQPAISIQIKHLEEEVGRDLFERRNRRLVLTQAGQIALEYANQIFNLGNELTEVLQAGSFLRKVHLNIGVLDRQHPKNGHPILDRCSFFMGTLHSNCFGGYR